MSTLRTLLASLCLVPLAAEDMTVFGLLEAGGWIGWTIVAGSMVMVALAIDQVLGLRRERRNLAKARERMAGRVLDRHRDEVEAWAAAQPSLIGRLLVAGLAVTPEHRERAVQEEAADYGGRLHRRAEHLLFIGNAAPLLGLLGTVVGMMQSFSIIAGSGGSADPGSLADGIAKALVTTCQGLLVALPALGIYTLIRNQLEVLIAETGRTVEQILFPERSAPGVTASTAKAPAVAVAGARSAKG